MTVRHGNTTPTLCAACGLPINAGTGVFTFETVHGLRFYHVGACARSVGAFPGGSASTWGEIVALRSHMIAANDAVTESDAAAAVRWRDEGTPQGAVSVDLLLIAAEGLAVFFVSWVVVKAIARFFVGV